MDHLKTMITNRANKLLAMKRLVHSEQFRIYYNLKDIKCKDIDELVNKGEINKLKELISDRLKSKMNIRDLQTLARQFCIPNYSRLSKEELIMLLEEVKAFKIF